mgnify:CR=1 FL=1
MDLLIKTPTADLDLHECGVLVVSCLDFRFRGPDQQFAHQALDTMHFDHVMFPGGAKSFATASNARYQLEEAIKKVGIGLHKIKRILVMTHWDCGAYGGSKSFASPEAEEAAYLADLQAARTRLAEAFPGIEILVAYSRRTGSDDLSYRFLES